MLIIPPPVSSMKTASGASGVGEALRTDYNPTTAGHTEMMRHPAGRFLLALSLGALGVVYGDIGTSPLYALRECFAPEHNVIATTSNILGVLSLIFWALTLIVSVKYLTFVMRADNKGEGGILALLSLAFPERKSAQAGKTTAVFVCLGLFGAALLYGDGMITPAISVLGAIEGLKVATPGLERWVVPITVAILVGLFSVQRVGTGSVGRFFGPVMILWFASIAALGIRGIIQAPEVFAALNPVHAMEFLGRMGWRGFSVLGAVFLAVTGAEALYADMGHFGRKPIRLAWFCVAMPALLLNYFGQGALLLRDPSAAESPFFRLAPSWALYPMVIIATAAAIIASQALISGAFSLTMQAIQLGYSPRMKVEHTSSSTRGQIYIPYVNWMLMLACIGLVIGFGSSSNLAAAYGIAVTLTMIITTLLLYFVERRIWGWSAWVSAPLCVLFLAVEIAFCGANLLKIMHGGWFPLVVGLLVFTVLTTWKTGRRVLGERLRSSFIPLPLFLEDVERSVPLRVPGTAVFLSSNADATPLALLHNLKHNRVLHKSVIFLTIQTEDVPHVRSEDRLQLEQFREGFHRVIARYGFMEDPNVPEILDRCRPLGLEFDWMNTTFFLSRETILATKSPGMALWREKLFAFLSRNAQRPTDFFRIPANRVVELGMQVEM
jgi:KUP system potassium uptake protein